MRFLPKIGLVNGGKENDTGLTLTLTHAVLVKGRVFTETSAVRQWNRYFPSLDSVGLTCKAGDNLPFTMLKNILSNNQKLFPGITPINIEVSSLESPTH